MSEAKVPRQYSMTMRDIEFRRKYELFYVKRRTGFYDVLRGIELEKLGHVCWSYGQWCFCPDCGENWYFGNTRSEAVWLWMKAEGGENECQK